jgi:hypothetical protein
MHPMRGLRRRQGFIICMTAGQARCLEETDVGCVCVWGEGKEGCSLPAAHCAAAAAAALNRSGSLAEMLPESKANVQ